MKFEFVCGFLRNSLCQHLYWLIGWPVLVFPGLHANQGQYVGSSSAPGAALTCQKHQKRIRSMLGSYAWPTTSNKNMEKIIFLSYEKDKSVGIRDQGSLLAAGMYSRCVLKLWRQS